MRVIVAQSRRALLNVDMIQEVEAYRNGRIVVWFDGVQEECAIGEYENEDKARTVLYEILNFLRWDDGTAYFMPDNEEVKNG